MDYVVQLIMAFLGSAGFSMLFRLRRELFLPACFGGMLGWGVYLIGTGLIWDGIFMPTFAASAFAAVYSEQLAIRLRVPATVLFIPAVVPLIPGSCLYYTMSYAVRKEWEQAGAYWYLTIQYALGIAIGMSLVYAIYQMRRNIHDRISDKQSERSARGAE